MSWNAKFLKHICSLRVVAFLAAAWGVSLLYAASAPAALIMEYEMVLDINANQDRAIRPSAVSCDQFTGDICVTDAQYSKIHVFNRNGIEIFKTGGFSRLSSPVDGSLDSNGDFVFIDKGENGEFTIRRLNFMGDPVDFAPEIPITDWEPRHLVITRDGEIVTLDSYHNILSKHDSNTGALLWNTSVIDDGSTELQLGRPVEAPDGRIYVPCGVLHSIIVFSEAGTYLGAFGKFGSGEGKLTYPVGIAIGPEGSILVLDRMRHKILMFDPEHVLLGEFGSMGAGVGQFYHPVAIAASNDGKVYVAQGFGSRVNVFNIRNTSTD